MLFSLQLQAVLNFLAFSCQIRCQNRKSENVRLISRRFPTKTIFDENSASTLGWGICDWNRVVLKKRYLWYPFFKITFFVREMPPPQCIQIIFVKIIFCWKSPKAGHSILRFSIWAPDFSGKSEKSQSCNFIHFFKHNDKRETLLRTPFQIS